jgi:hypothetical protein
MTEILVSRSAARVIFDEVRRWVDRGLTESGVPLESLLYPLSVLVPAGRMICPLELASLEDIREVVIDGAAIPPDDVKAFSSHNCHFDLAGGEEVNRRFNEAIDEELHRRPRLAVLSKLHTHPFEGGAFLSSGDQYFGVASPAARAWRERRGLATAVLHVVHPDRSPRPSGRRWGIDAAGARCPAGVTWRIRSWGLTRAGELADLGDARIVPDRHPSVRAARRKPYWSTARGGRWCDAQKLALRATGFRVSRHLLGRGWRRYLVQGRHFLVLALPPDLPRVAPRALRVIDASRDLFEELPVDLDGGSSLASLSLLELVRRFMP